MTDDLISRKALKEAMWDESHSIATFTECGTEEARFGLTASEIEEIINNAPTVEYTFEEAFQKTVCEQRLYCPERPQGRWIDTGVVDELGHVAFECSVCHKSDEREETEKMCLFASIVVQLCELNNELKELGGRG